MSTGLDTSAQAALTQDTQQKIATDDLTKRLSGGKNNDKRLREACQGFEAVFLNQLITQMRNTVPKQGLLHSQYEERYQSLCDQELAQSLSKQGGIGLGDMLYRQMKDKIAASGGGQDQAQAKLNTLMNQPTQVLAQGQAGMDIAAKGYAYDPAGALNLRKNPGAGLAEPQSGGLTTPLNGQVSSDFGWRIDPFSGQKAWHAGLDIAAPEGSAVAACQDGQVTFAGQLGGYGNVVMVEHSSGLTSIYGHNSRNSVAVGDKVKAGQKIAEVGSTGRSTGPHLHFELRKNDVAVDPKGYLSQTLASRGTGTGKS